MMAGNANDRQRLPGGPDQVDPGFGKVDHLNPAFEDLFFTEERFRNDLAVLDGDPRDVFHDRLLGAGGV
jgi:hypothetical protein